jgi:hypothetical protein
MRVMSLSHSLTAFAASGELPAAVLYYRNAVDMG